jgi:signal transduction histidine kinase
MPAEAETAVPEHDDAAFALHAAISALLGLVVTVIWAATGGGTFWAGWVWTGLGAAVAVHAALRWALKLESPGVRAVAIAGSLTGILTAVHVLSWALSGGGAFWPLYPAAVTWTATAIVALVVFRSRLTGLGRERELTERVDELTRTRRGAVEVQAAELRRIERDLHDGAQARLVALSMQLGRAEERLSDQPEIADLVRQARGEAGAAIAELRDLARGIAPPVLADRGLVAAVEGLGRRAPVPVTVSADIGERPSHVVETAAYFVVAEGLTNVAKHAPEATACVTLSRSDGRLVVEIADDGPGGANPRGAGLTGLRHRAEAIDGVLTVAGGPAGGTTIRAELPCA